MRTGLFAFMFAGLVACGSSLGGSSGKGGQSTTGSAGATGGGTILGGGGAGGSSVGTGSGGDIACVPGIPATTQIRRMTNREYDAVIRDLLDIATVDLGGGAKLPSASLYPDADGPMPPDAWRLYRDVGAAIAKAVMADATRKAHFISCDPAAAGCLTTTIKTFGRKAFRRPLTDADVTRFTDLGQALSSGTPDDVAEATLLGFLISPSFIMVPELNTTPEPAAQAVRLSSHEVATRLAFMIWGSVADDALNTAADNDQLQTKDQILAQAQRMIALRDKAAPKVAAFHRHWVRMDDPFSHWWRIEHDTTKFPSYTSTANTGFAEELDDFFADVAFTNGSYKDLFLSSVAFVNKNNAAIYGLSPGPNVTRTQLDPMQRPGFLTRAGFLSSYSHFDTTAPMLRGAFITTYLLGIDLGAPFPTDQSLTPPAGDYKTNRAITEAIANQSAVCSGCHTILNPPGYVLENYDAIGKWQTTDPLGGPIDASATVTLAIGNTKKISNARQLMEQIAASPQGKLLYAQSLVSYGYGREPNPNDRCVVEQIGTKLTSDGYTILDLLTDLTQADSFRLRVRAVP